MDNETQEQIMNPAQSQRSYVVTLFLAYFLGIFGIHRFYTGYVWIGIAQLLTCGCFGIWTVIDIISLTLNKYKDAQGKELSNYNQGCALIILSVIIVLFIFGGITGVLSFFTGK
ncbi:MAG: TM2 domain-containing protein [Candidatus Melainabacteria bacterium]|jgi:TM2 domain containing protein|nr:MAG: TM2 domain-containing protein [Candidatus Melainabacteria bacterium]